MAYKIAGMYVATAAIIATMVLQLAIQWLRHRKVSRMLLVSTIIVVILGGITLTLRKPIFIEWKVTIVDWLFAIAFLASRYFGSETLTQRLLGHAVTLNAETWRQLNLMWIVNFVVLGAANLFVVYNFSEATWVNFKLFGTLGLTIITAIGQALWIAARASDEAPEPESEEN
ncbi:MAG TPA: inner membrane-spanning protein YciB [Bryobacteraceae bacterium]|nr:inner membrane-spanning protein YciB [Bryobacteraceae bacterium]